ncbi:MAG: hypothetical protein JW783_13680 [Bacteroidales bacterium]|nr:hypothetical protein [Bacteroidales bacterium]MBN2749442.1 hypothetical protein [Bacteroidales bacterium]
MKIPNVKTLMTRGVTIKEEKVKSLTANVLPHTMVLENYEPYPGYYGYSHPPFDPTPRSIFIVLAKDYNNLELARVMVKVGRERLHDCDGTIGYIKVDNDTYQCIRIKHLPCFDEIPDIQNSFISNGIEMLKHKEIDKPVLITVHKSFLVEVVADGVYKNITEENKFYFELDSALTWEQFKAATEAVRNNIPNNLFDAALGFFWALQGPADVVRIYDTKAKLERVNEIKRFYDAAIKRL